SQHFSCLVAHLGEQPGVVRWLRVEMDVVVLPDLGEEPDVILRPLGEVARQVMDVVIGLVPVRDVQQPRCQILLRAVQLVQHQRQPLLAHDGTSSTSLLAPPLVGGNADDTGLDAVVVGAGAGFPSEPATRVTRAAAVLNSGCLDAGSQSVSVSSFAARPSSSGPAGLSVSQYP